VRAAGIILATVVALTLQTTLERFLIRGTVAVDLILVVVVYAALSFGPVTGLLTGTFSGLVGDYINMSTGVVGIGSLATTIVGFLAGIIGTQFIVAQPLPRFVVFFMATLIHAAIFYGLYAMLGLWKLETPWTAVFGQSLGNALVGVVAFQVAELLPGVADRRRLTRSRLRR
jgi:rod shape-determining protein MreD